MPVRYRVQGEVDWYHGTTENVSRSGALIRIERPLLLSARIQLVLDMPARLIDSAPCEVVGLATVCRRGRSAAGHDVMGVQFDVVAVEALDAAITHVMRV